MKDIIFDICSCILFISLTGVVLTFMLAWLDCCLDDWFGITIFNHHNVDRK